MGDSARPATQEAAAVDRGRDELFRLVGDAFWLASHRNWSPAFGSSPASLELRMQLAMFQRNFSERASRVTCSCTP